MGSAVVTVCILLVLATALGDGDASSAWDKFIVHLSESSPEEGQTLVLTCILDGPPQASISPPSSYEWVKDAKVIPGQTEQTLTIEKLSVQDEGDYQCGPPHINVLKEIFHLNVFSLRKAQSRTRRGVNIYDRTLTSETFYVDEYGSNLEGRPLRLRCYHFGPPSTDRTATFIWFKNGEVISGETNQDIHIKSLTKQDEADYMCGIQDSDVPRKTYHLQVLSTLPQPTVFKDRFPVCGQSCSLECVIMSGYKKTDTMIYTWYKGSTQIEGQSGQVLRLDNVTKHDTGYYTCTARDGPIETTSTHSLPLEVTPFVSPEISIKPSTSDCVVKGILGESLILTCEVTNAYPRVPYDGFSWSYLPSHEGQVQPLAGRTKTLTLGPLTREHSGQYTCQARNDQDFPSVTMIGKAFVNVEIAYLENIYVTPPVEVNEGDWVTLTCRVDSYPHAHLSWLMDGHEVRRVVDNLDHFVIPKVTCTDSMNYTCLASNTDMPGRDINATTQLLVLCNNDHQKDTLSLTTPAGVSAQFNFSLPKWAAMVVVHPSGQDIITVYKNCSYDIFPEFASRCLNPHCDLFHHQFFFTLTQITEKDEGNYVCMEVGNQRKAIPNCQHRLILTKPAFEATAPDSKISWIFGVNLVVLVVIIVVLIIVCGPPKLRAFFLHKFHLDSKHETLWKLRSLVTEPEHKDRSFDSLFAKGMVYIFPQLERPNQNAKAGPEEEESETTPLISTPPQNILDTTYGFNVKDRIRHVLQTISGAEGLPSFILHNIRLGRQKDAILILSRKVGIVLLVLKETGNAVNKSIEEAISCLMDAKQAVTETLKELVKPGSITAVIASNNLSTIDAAYIKKQGAQKVEVLEGLDRMDFQQWAERLSSRPDSKVWDWDTPGVDNADIAYKMAAGKFLALGRSSYTGEPSKLPTETDLWLLTPLQMNVRDSKATLLHLWGNVGDGKKTLLIHKAKQWLAEGKAVVLTVRKETYDLLFARITELMLQKQEKEGVGMIRVCCTCEALAVALKDLQGQKPKMDICIITDILHHRGMFQNILETVTLKAISAVWSAGTTNLHIIDANLSRKAQDLGWQTIHLPPCIRSPRSTGHLLNLLRSTPSAQHFPSTDDATSAGDKAEWKIVDHCLHQDPASSTSPCVQCKEELSTVLHSSGRGHWENCVAFHTGEPQISRDAKRLQTILQGLGVPLSIASHGKDQSISTLGEQEDPGLPLMGVAGLKHLGAKGILLVHLDDRDTDSKCQSLEQRKFRLNSHRRQWMQAASKCKGQVILLLLTPSPARSLLNLPDPGIP